MARMMNNHFKPENSYHLVTHMEDEFDYEHILFFIRSVYISVLFISIIAIVAISFPDMLYVGLFIVLYIIYLIMFGISPILTRHGISDDRMVLRQGFLFKIEIPWDDILKVERADALSLGYGVTPSLRKPIISMATSKSNSVKIKLKEARRFKSVMGKLADEIMIDVNEPDRFIEKAMEHTSQ